ncbi:hypothetical protein Pint_07143 [Pistacia integerrima]|uniref:Uncharacterized protein n=4 Tax=Pistacia TaxID=55512 RepID=A0ACC1AIW7_9ROSI|nr:hypothetical protein Pint_07175 [Pistacia integerrima]KAJ0026134.1 hypothetical protein Pint_07143 [Pistacia integerrima]KAJ0085992.1 hypothetical protein Patl1_07250 [Pistacia atlantica]KAJ0086614.1 hypothetical protein Patl1_07270 [Pistacia atlantica]
MNTVITPPYLRFVC